MKGLINQIRNAHKLLSNDNLDKTVNGLSEENPIELAVSLKALESFIKKAKTVISDKVITELDKENNQQFGGAKVYKSTSATRLSYDHNEEWNRLQKEKEQIEKAQKEIEAKMKSAYNNGCSFIDDSSGEVFEPAQYKSGGKEIYIVK